MGMKNLPHSQTKASDCHLISSKCQNVLAANKKLEGKILVSPLAPSPILEAGLS